MIHVSKPPNIFSSRNPETFYFLCSPDSYLPCQIRTAKSACQNFLFLKFSPHTVFIHMMKTPFLPIFQFKTKQKPSTHPWILSQSISNWSRNSVHSTFKNKSRIWKQLVQFKFGSWSQLSSFRAWTTANTSLINCPASIPPLPPHALYSQRKSYDDLFWSDVFPLLCSNPSTGSSISPRVEPNFPTMTYKIHSDLVNVTLLTSLATTSLLNNSRHAGLLATFITCQESSYLEN